MHNCFTGDTTFLTHKGPKRFDSFQPGEIVYVKDKNNETRQAIVRQYGMQTMQRVYFTSDQGNEKYVDCTKDHRWILENEKVTTDLKIGDKLYSNESTNYEQWTVKKIGKAAYQMAYCVNEPVTHSFTLDGGMVTGNCDLINLEDMLQNGTVISGTMIEKPHSFHTACNITTQIIAQVASSQYGLTTLPY